MREKGKNGKYVCPCCGYATLDEVDAYEICKICFWEEDDQDDPKADECWGGPNKVSLTDGRKNLIHIGASDPKDIEHVRAPTAEDERVREFKIVENRVINVKTT